MKYWSKSPIRRSIGDDLRYLIVLGMLVAARSGLAQTPLVPGRLTVRPREMATGTQTRQAGMHLLDSLGDAGYGTQVYVPEQCVGTRRCPLVVCRCDFGLVKPSADQYGTLVLNVRDGAIVGRVLETDPSDPFVIRKIDDEAAADVRRLDAEMQQVLRTYAVDPAKIAIIGSSNWAAYAGFFGRSNLDVFSRIALLSPAMIVSDAGPRDTTTQIFASGGMAEPGFLQAAMGIAQQARLQGHPVKPMLFFKGHSLTDFDYARAWRWFHESWAAPDSTALADPHAIADSLPLLTTEVLAQMLAVWDGFRQEPKSTFHEVLTARSTIQKEVPVPVGTRLFSLMIADMAALAAKYPSVAASLKKAGLSAQQWEAYRIALVSARATDLATNSEYVAKRDPRLLENPVALTSVLGKNIAFVREHAKELENGGMWSDQ